MHDLAETVVHGMPLLFAAWLAGEIDRQRVRVFVRYLTGLTPAQIQKICRIAVPKAPKLTTGQLAVLLRRMVIAIDPQAMDRWYRKSIREGDVTAYIDRNGTVVMTATGLPADEAEAACLRLQDLAAAVKQAGHPGRIGEIRCALFLGLLDGRFHHKTTDQVITALIAAAQRAAAQQAADGGSAGQGDPTADNSGPAHHESADPGECAGNGKSAGNGEPPGEAADSAGTGCDGCGVTDERVGIEVPRNTAATPNTWATSTPAPRLAYRARLCAVTPRSATAPAPSPVAVGPAAATRTTPSTTAAAAPPCGSTPARPAATITT